jgi:hypothetical protein
VEERGRQGLLGDRDEDEDKVAEVSVKLQGVRMQGEAEGRLVKTIETKPMVAVNSPVGQQEAEVVKRGNFLMTKRRRAPIKPRQLMRQEVNRCQTCCPFLHI